MKRIMIPALLSVLCLGSAMAQAQDGARVRFETIATGRQTRVREAARLVIRDQAAWVTLWKRHAATGAAPAVDFAQDMVIAMFAGESPVPGVLSIRFIMRDAKGLAVSYAHGDARPIVDTDGLPRTNAFTIVRLAASPLPVRFLQVKSAPVVRSP